MGQTAEIELFEVHGPISDELKSPGILSQNRADGKGANCLTKNLLEMESLPQIRNLLEMREISFAAKESGGVKDEVNDERKKAHRGGHGRAISAGAEERENSHLE